VPNFVKISQTVAEILPLNGFKNGGCPPSWIFEIEFFTIAVVKLRLNSGSGDGGGCSGIKIQQSGRMW